ncbi:MAG: hypothetical protein AUJ51_00555 [Elusimicrobia bacterium CG1_02_56_21]|nr:MAG: hypothetical protein AUJ51_00555 [Elusimicrobia bacterium CG1_02_56_21]
MENKTAGAPPLKGLYLEDSAEDAELVREQLAANMPQLKLTIAANKEEFRAALEKDGCDIILADFKVTGFDGFASLKMANELLPGVPVICVSGAIGEETAVGLLKAGVADYIFKDRPARLPAAIARTIAAARSIIARNKAEFETREARGLLQAFIDNTPALVYMLDVEKRFVLANKALGLLLGRPEGELIGKTRAEILPAEVAARHEENDRQVMEANAGRLFEESQDPEDKAGKTFLTVKFPLRGSGGELLGVGGISTDITERRRMQSELIMTNRDLQEKKRLLENFLYITTHDLRTPLVNITGFSEELAKDLQTLRETLAAAALPQGIKEKVNAALAESIPHSLDYLTDSVGKINRMLTALLDISRLGRQEQVVATVDMNAALKTILATCAWQLEKTGCSVSVGDLPPFRGDLSAATHIFTNLLSNAINYRKRDRKLEINISGKVNGGTVLYRVCDNGLGIKPGDLAKVWDVFYQAHVQSPGVERGEGIGLTVVKQLAERSGGAAWAESKEGEGSVFYVELPAEPGLKSGGKQG